MAFGEHVVRCIRNPELLTRWGWECLDGCFGDSRITPSDIDAIIERRGRFLAIETKMPGTIVPAGQRLLLEALARLPGWWVIVVWGDHEHGETDVTSMAVVGKDDITSGTGRTACVADLQDVVAAWYQLAERV